MCVYCRKIACLSILTACLLIRLVELLHMQSIYDSDRERAMTDEIIIIIFLVFANRRRFAHTHAHIIVFIRAISFHFEHGFDSMYRYSDMNE